MWTLSQDIIEGSKLFLLIGIREKEILAALQTNAETLTSDIETFFGLKGFPYNSKIVGLYVQYQVRPDENVVKKYLTDVH